jgi:hypothetical protein
VRRRRLYQERRRPSKYQACHFVRMFITCCYIYVCMCVCLCVSVCIDYCTRRGAGPEITRHVILCGCVRIYMHVCVCTCINANFSVCACVSEEVSLSLSLPPPPPPLSYKYRQRCQANWKEQKHQPDTTRYQFTNRRPLCVLHLCVCVCVCVSVCLSVCLSISPSVCV